MKLLSSTVLLVLLGHMAIAQLGVKGMYFIPAHLDADKYSPTFNGELAFMQDFVERKVRLHISGSYVWLNADQDSVSKPVAVSLNGASLQTTQITRYEHFEMANLNIGVDFRLWQKNGWTLYPGLGLNGGAMLSQYSITTAGFTEEFDETDFFAGGLARFGLEYATQKYWRFFLESTSAFRYAFNGDLFPSHQIALGAYYMFPVKSGHAR